MRNARESSMVEDRVISIVILYVSVAHISPLPFCCLAAGRQAGPGTEAVNCLCGIYPSGPRLVSEQSSPRRPR